ncbi:MAG: hypothetical protein K2P58_15295 [Hyphomonadaceae bacterium]|nr:hypothetical protein [Hyphomonadaceae bacterium]
MAAPIPRRIPPLAWRKPALIWTPLALAAAILWPYPLLQDDPGLGRLVLLGLVATLALTLIALAVAWALGHPPRTRRLVVLYVVVAGAAVSTVGPFAANSLVSGPGGLAPIAASPLAAVMGLPVALASGLLFAWLALTRRDTADEDMLGDNVFVYRGGALGDDATP